MPVSDLVNLSGLMTDAECPVLVRQHRWPGGVHCPGGGSSIRHRIDRPMAIVMGEWSEDAPRRRRAAPVVPDAPLCTCSTAEQGDHFLVFKNPIKFTSNPRTFLEW